MTHAQISDCCLLPKMLKSPTAACPNRINNFKYISEWMEDWLWLSDPQTRNSENKNNIRNSQLSKIQISTHASDLGACRSTCQRQHNKILQVQVQIQVQVDGTKTNVDIGLKRKRRSNNKPTYLPTYHTHAHIAHSFQAKPPHWQHKTLVPGKRKKCRELVSDYDVYNPQICACLRVLCYIRRALVMQPPRYVRIHNAW